MFGSKGHLTMLGAQERRRLEDETAAKTKIIEDLVAEKERIQRDVSNLKVGRAAQTVVLRVAGNTAIVWPTRYDYQELMVCYSSRRTTNDTSRHASTFDPLSRRGTSANTIHGCDIAAATRACSVGSGCSPPADWHCQ